jgi:3-dehydroquinate dehydratase/shikimate dehydrogenase
MKSPLFKDRICAVIAAPTAAEAAAQLQAAIRAKCRSIEIRFDWLRDFEQQDTILAWVNRHRPRLDLIATWRRIESGGRWTGSITKEGFFIKLSGGLGFRWRDVTLQTAEFFRAKLGVKYLREWLGKERLIISVHDFKKTPRNLRALAKRMDRLRGDAIKIATQCRSYADGVRLLALCRGRSDVIAVPMGEIGAPLRVLALREGSALGYASMGAASVPGQLSLQEMRDLYRAGELNRHTRVYGVIGNPVAHSLSPLIHNRAFRHKKLNAVFLPFLVADLRDFLHAAGPLGIRGFSVTLPHKQRILEHLDECDPLAARIGAVNTVVVRAGGKLYGCNTDYVGVLRALESKMALRGSRVLVYGAGGAARAVAFALAQGGSVVCICARRPQRAQALARAAGGEAVPRPRLKREFFDAIVNATPVGMHPQQDESPLRAEELNSRLVFDTIYRPLRTKLLDLAQKRGIETVSGVEMFLAQGAAQFEIWTEQRAPMALMRRTVLEKLKGGEEGGQGGQGGGGGRGSRGGRGGC